MAISAYKLTAGSTGTVIEAPSHDHFWILGFSDTKARIELRQFVTLCKQSFPTLPTLVVRTKFFHPLRHCQHPFLQQNDASRCILIRWRKERWSVEFKIENTSFWAGIVASFGSHVGIPINIIPSMQLELSRILVLVGISAAFNILGSSHNERASDPERD